MQIFNIPLLYEDLHKNLLKYKKVHTKNFNGKIKVKDKFDDGLIKIRLRPEFQQRVIRINYITFSGVFSTLGGYEAFFNAIFIKFAPFGMLYFLFNLAVYIREHYKDKFLNELIMSIEFLIKKLEDYKKGTMFKGLSTEHISWTKHDNQKYLVIKQKLNIDKDDITIQKELFNDIYNLFDSKLK